MTAANGATATKYDNKILLLQSIYRYLKTNRFPKTVKKLKSEAKLDEVEIADTLFLDLEEIFSKHLESRTHAVEAPGKSVKVPDLKSNGNTKNSNEEDSSIEKVSKKNKKVKNDDLPGAEDESGLTKSDAKPTTEVISEPERKPKEKKESKKSYDNTNQEVKAKDNAPKAESETHTDKKKKKKKLGSMKDVTTENDEKNSCDAASEKQHKSENKNSDNDVEDSSIKTKESRKRKWVSAENDGKVFGASLDDEYKHSKTKETKGEEYIAKKAEAKLGDENHIDEVMNPDSGGKSTARKSAKKQRNGSAEPTTVKAFQRVKVEEVVITDERLKDNSYWAKDGAESGYGAKAQEVLGQVRGKDFRHEKTKKKRGSYRGGQIDFNSHSIKFNDSDNE